MIIGYAHTSSLRIIDINGYNNDLIRFLNKYRPYAFSFIEFIIPYLAEGKVLTAFQFIQLGLFLFGYLDGLDNLILGSAPLPYRTLAHVSRNALAIFPVGAAYAQSGEASAILWDKIASIEPLGYECVYDIEVDGTHNFIANGIFAHNTYIGAPTVIPLVTGN